MIKEGNSSTTISNPTTIQVYFDWYISLLSDPFHLSNSSTWKLPSMHSNSLKNPKFHWKIRITIHIYVLTWINNRQSCWSRSVDVSHQSSRRDVSGIMHSVETAMIEWKDWSLERLGCWVGCYLKNPNPRFQKQRRRAFWKTRRCRQLHSVCETEDAGKWKPQLLIRKIECQVQKYKMQ